ncbi:MAG: hypothetical protein JOY66_24720 [Acetobacteraceae bacterium]|nr:hypothetical protein [Acetobacteraceae bacterium]
MREILVPTLKNPHSGICTTLSARRLNGASEQQTRIDDTRRHRSFALLIASEGHHQLALTTGDGGAVMSVTDNELEILYHQIGKHLAWKNTVRARRGPCGQDAAAL